tara:strand:+ start:1892 stop:2134 length:243 start_codon:yes stop_codon:yes gene_type:complete
MQKESLSLAEQNALNRFINSDRTSDKTKSAFKKVLDKYSINENEKYKNDISELKELLEFANEKNKIEILKQIQKLKTEFR